MASPSLYVHSRTCALYDELSAETDAFCWQVSSNIFLLLCHDNAPFSLGGPGSKGAHPMMDDGGVNRGAARALARDVLRKELSLG